MLLWQKHLELKHEFSLRKTRIHLLYHMIRLVSLSFFAATINIFSFINNRQMMWNAKMFRTAHSSSTNELGIVNIENRLWQNGLQWRISFASYGVIKLIGNSLEFFSIHELIRVRISLSDITPRKWIFTRWENSEIHLCLLLIRKSRSIKIWCVIKPFIRIYNIRIEQLFALSSI